VFSPESGPTRCRQARFDPRELLEGSRGPRSGVESSLVLRLENAESRECAEREDDQLWVKVLHRRSPKLAASRRRCGKANERAITKGPEIASGSSSRILDEVPARVFPMRFRGRAKVNPLDDTTSA